MSNFPPLPWEPVLNGSCLLAILKTDGDGRDHMTKPNRGIPWLERAANNKIKHIWEEKFARNCAVADSTCPPAK